MNALRASVTPRLLLVAGLALTPLLVLGGPDQFVPRSWRAFWDLGHALLFLLLVSGVLSVWSGWRRRPFVTAFAALALTLLLAVSIEWLQGFVGRDRSVEDLWISVCGAIFGLLYSPALSALLRPGLVRPVRALVTSGLLIVLSLPAASALLDEWRARDDFPVLSDFTSVLELDRWDGAGGRSRVGAVAGVHSGAMLVRVEPAEAGGIHLRYFPRDWSAYRTLVIRINNDGPPIAMTCRLNDVAHDLQTPHENSDHYEESFTLQTGWQEVRLDLETAATSLSSRRMDLASMNGLTCLWTNLDRPLILELDRVWLTR